ncbi:hypothetical protein FSC37_03235 [Piscinibacter aquaticus]|uniref:Uncharacterized protein n=1 Tax=Piscinibacter aquaticus TaxID=392597 RepID=A0A5C6TY02_9BURK|nr:hypothetical protein FSC37_03235 [Piscinibacter aquaticus]
MKVFEPWEQVAYLWDSNANPLFLIGHPHFPRYLVAYPGLVLEEVIPGRGFSLYMCAFFATNLVLFRRVAGLHLSGSVGAAVLGLFIVAHFAMNGRGVIAWCSWLLCCWVSLRLAHGLPMARQVPATMISLILATVSTGVFVVVCLALALVPRSPLLVAPARSDRHADHVGRRFPLIYAASDFFLLAVEKNVDFYGGGFAGAVAMLEHGLGTVLLGPSYLTLAIGALFGMAFILVVPMIMLGPGLTAVQVLAIFAVLGGLFGFTVLTLAIPPALALLGFWLQGVNRRSRRPSPDSLKLAIQD